MEPAPPALSPQIELTDVDVPRGDVLSRTPIIEEVRWTLCPEEFWVVGARPGAGKTDLFFTTAGLLRPLRGQRVFFGNETADLRGEAFVRERLRIGMVFDSGRLFPELTVAENIALPVRYHATGTADEALARVHRSLELTGLERYADRTPAQVVRSLHQRIGLARALALDPEVLLVDSPLSATDPRQARWWIDFLTTLAAGHPMLDRRLTVAVAVDDFRPWLEGDRQFAAVCDKRFHHVGRSSQLANSPVSVVPELLGQHDFSL